MSETDKIVSVYLKFGADQQAIEKAIAEFKKIQNELVALEQDAKSLKGNITKALEHGDDVSELNTELKTVEAAISNLKKKADTELGAGLSSSFDKAAQSAQRSGASVSQSFNLRDIGEKMNFVGQAMTSAGQGMTNTLMGAVNAYLATAGQYSQEAQKWNAVQKEMQNAYARIGAVAIDKLTPTLEIAADLLNELATFVEENPQLIGAIAGTATALTLGGQFVSGLAQLAMLKGSIDALITILGGGATAAAGTGGVVAGGVSLGAIAIAAAPYVIAGLLAVGGIALIVSAIKLYNVQNPAVPATPAEITKTAAAVQSLSQPFGSDGTFDPYTGSKLHRGTNMYLHRVPTFPLMPTPTYKPITLSASEITARQLAADDREKAQLLTLQLSKKLQAETDNQKALKDIEKKYADERVSIEAKSAAERTSILADLADQQKQAETAYRSQRAQIIRDGGVEIQRIEEDSQKRLEQMRKEHDGRVTDLTASRDALGLAKENRDFEAKKSEEVNNTNVEIKRRRDDLALKLRDLDESYRREQQQRQQAAYARLKQIDSAARAELKLLDEKQKAERAMQIDHYKALLQTLTSEFQKQLVAVRTASGYYPAPIMGHKANGGSVLDGMTYLVGERGPELFTAPRDGSIIPNGLTAAMLNPRSQGAGGAFRGNMTLKIESASLTMTEILSEVDKRFERYNRGMESLFAT